jgi:hypothetical protein
MVLGQDAIEQRGLTCAQKAGEHRHRYTFDVGHENTCGRGQPRNVSNSQRAGAQAITRGKACNSKRRGQGTGSGGITAKKAASND